jgi:hypothetical protein
VVQLHAYENINNDEPTAKVSFRGAANELLGKEASSEPLGLEKALEDMSEDEDNSLWLVEVGLFDLEDDPRTPLETIEVLVAAETQDEANDKAQSLAEEEVPVVRDMAFSVTGAAEKVDANNYQ